LLEWSPPSQRARSAGQTLLPEAESKHLLAAYGIPIVRTEVAASEADAVRLAGPQAVWKDVGQRLLDDTCQQRTGRHEEDGCWPSFE